MHWLVLGFNEETIGTVEHQFIKQFLSICSGLILSMSVCGYICMWTELNAETLGRLEHLICQLIPVNMWWSYSSSFSIWRHMPVNRIQKQTNWNVEHLIKKTDFSQYVGLILCASVCGCGSLWTEFNQETNRTVEHLIIKLFLSICGGLFLSLSVCGSIRLWIEFNAETIGTVKHQILQAISVSMWWSVSFSFSVWIHCVWTELNQETFGTNPFYVCGLIWNDYILIKKQLEFMSTWSSSNSCQYVVVCFFIFKCVDALACEQNSINKQLEVFSIKPSKHCLSICNGLILSLSVCVHLLVNNIKWNIIYYHRLKT